MNSIRNSFFEKKLFMPFVTAYFPNKDVFFEILSLLSQAGVGMIEIGLPFSDPVADGSVIQHSSQVALEQGFSLSDFFESFKVWRQNYQTPCLVMTYANLIYQYGSDSFLQKCSECSIEGLIIPDLPPENMSTFFSNNFGCSFSYLICETTSLDRVRYLSGLDNIGFIYYVSRLGVTGVGGLQLEACQDQLHSIRKELGDLPIAVGFGVSHPYQAHQLFQVADGVIVGSAVIQFISDHYQDSNFDTKFLMWVRSFFIEKEI